jgi:hypothetical protein
MGSSNFYIQPFHYTNSGGTFYLNQVEDSTDLSMLNAKIKAAYPAPGFNGTQAYTFTWSMNINGQAVLFQVAICWDTSTNGSYMIVSYGELGVPSDQLTYFVDGANQKNYFDASLTESNCGVPGQYIFELNTIEGLSLIFIVFFLVMRGAQTEICENHTKIWETHIEFFTKFHFFSLVLC